MRALLTSFLILTSSILNAAEFNRYGFSIDELETTIKDENVFALSMSLPAKDGFAPNINVQVQHFREGMEKYMEISRTQFKQMGVKVLDIRIEGDIGYLEYTNVVQGMDMRFFAKVIKRGDTVYLATATVPEKRWLELSPLMVSRVESLTLTRN